jgi:hypothetical protein
VTAAKKGGRPSRGEGTTVINVRLSTSLLKEVRAVATKLKVPIASVLRAGGVAVARRALTWTEEERKKFLDDHGGAS